jgi:protein TonB
MVSRLHIAIAISVALHASVFLVRCEQDPIEERLDETVLDLQAEEEILPEVQAPVMAPPVAALPPPPPPMAEAPPEPEVPPPPDAPTEVMRPIDSAPQIEAPPQTPIVTAYVPGPTAPKGTPSGVSGSGNSEMGVIGAEVLDNRDFKPFGNQKPTYPEVPRKLNLEGSVSLKILVGPQGKVEEVQVIQWTGHPTFAESAKSTASVWKFAPPRYQGKPAKAWYKRTIEFRLQ